MSIRQGKKLIASSTTNGFNLFDCKWADHILNNISWLRADTFSWQSGEVYVAAYQHLVEDVGAVTTYYCWGGIKEGLVYTKSATPSVGDKMYYYENGVMIESSDDDIAGGTITNASDSYISNANGYSYVRDASGDVDAFATPAQTDTIGGITITYYLAEDGHKICLPDQESNLSALYEATGVAWYYLLDTENKQFKLPRTKFGFTGIRNGVGGYVAPGLPNITGEVQVYWETDTTPSGAFYKTSNNYSERNDKNGNPNLGFDASRSNSIYGNSDTVQPPATEMYLYFYVGNYVENATTVDVGKLTEIVNDFDIDTFKPQVDEVKDSAIVDINDAKTDAIGSLTNLATDLGSSLKYGNVGDIFYTSRLDVSLNGAVECNGNLYNTTDFSGVQSIGNLLRDSKVPYISLSEYQTTVNTYGSCRCFGWDGGTEFRVPKLSNVFIEAGIAATAGEFITAGLPNITGQVGQIDFSGSRSFSGAFINVDSPSGDTGATHSGGTRTTVGFSASRSSSIYGNSTTVQPPAVRYRAMVQLAFGATDEAVVTAGNVFADVSELNSHRVIAFQAPTSANDYTWYRKYADGWVEQGGEYVGNAKTITPPVIMATDKYQVAINKQSAPSYWATTQLTVGARTTTSFTVNTYGDGASMNVSWQVSGMAA